MCVWQRLISHSHSCIYLKVMRKFRTELTVLWKQLFRSVWLWTLAKFVHISLQIIVLGGKKKKREYYIIGTLVCDVCSFNFKKTRWTFKLQLGLLSGQNWLPLSYDTLLSPTSSSIPHHHLEPSVLNEFSSRVSRKLVKTKGTQSRALWHLDMC